MSVEPYSVKDALYDVAAEARPAEAARRAMGVYMLIMSRSDMRIEDELKSLSRAEEVVSNLQSFL